MPHKSRALVLFVCLELLLSQVAVAADNSWTEAQLRMATTFELIKGHLISALENHKLGKIPLAQAHAAHPLHEEYQALPSSFAADHPGLDKALREALTQLQQSMGSQRHAAVMGTEAEAVFQLLDHTLQAVLPAEIRNSLQFRSAVLAHLIEEVGEEYGEAVEDGKVINVAEYQDAFGFLQRVRALLDQLAERLQTGERPPMRGLLKDLEDALPGVMPPSTPVSSEVVEKRAKALVALLQKNVGK